MIDTLTRIRRDLHRIPELDFDLPQTIEEYAEKSYGSHLFPDENDPSIPAGFHTTSRRCEPSFDGNILLGTTEFSTTDDGAICVTDLRLT